MARIKILLPENSRTMLTTSTSSNNIEPQKLPQILATVAATLSAFSAGMCLSWSSPATLLLRHPDSHLNVSDSEAAWIGSLLTLGACVGAVPAGALATRLGRKRLLQILALPLLASWLMLAYSGCVYGLYAARFLAGLGIGAVSVAAPMYVAELAHESMRGTLGTFFQLQITFGLLAEYILGGTVADFKSLALISSLLPVVFLVCFTFMPETPAHLYSTGKLDAARESLRLLRGPGYVVDMELEAIADELAKASTSQAAGLSELVGSRAAAKATIIAVGLMAFQQLSGINAVLFYAAKIFSETGSSILPNTSAMLVGAVQCVATLASTVLVDKAGRKVLLFASAAMMSACLLALGVFFHLKLIGCDLSGLSSLPLISLMIFIVMFSIGFGPIPWMMMGEIFPPRTKPLASSIAACVNWTLAFIVTNQFEGMAGALGMGATFAMFGLISATGAVFVAALLPETRGRSVEEVQRVLAGHGEVDCGKKTLATTTFV